MQTLQTELQGQVDLVSGQRDSLQSVLDSLLAPKEVAVASTKKPVAKKPAPKKEEPKDNKIDLGQKSGTNNNKVDVGQKSGGSKKLNVGQK